MAKRDSGRKRVSSKTQLGLGLLIFAFSTAITDTILGVWFQAAGMEETVLSFVIRGVVSAIGVALILWALGFKQQLRRR